jgi:hypothetical protein
LILKLVCRSGLWHNRPQLTDYPLHQPGKARLTFFIAKAQRNVRVAKGIHELFITHLYLPDNRQQKKTQSPLVKDHAAAHKN